MLQKCCVGVLMMAGVSAQAQDLSFKCSFSESCGTLKETGCWDADGAFVLNFEQGEGFSAVWDGEVWRSQPISTAYTRDDLTSLILFAPSGENGLLSVKDDWNFAITVHYTGLGDSVDWYSATGTCGDVS